MIAYIRNKHSGIIHSTSRKLWDKQWKKIIRNMINNKAVVLANLGEERGKKVTTINCRLEPVNHPHNKSGKPKLLAGTPVPNNITELWNLTILQGGSLPLKLSKAFFFSLRSPVLLMLPQPQNCCQSKLKSRCPLSHKIRATFPSHEALHTLVSITKSMKRSRKNGCVIKV